LSFTASRPPQRQRHRLPRPPPTNILPSPSLLPSTSTTCAENRSAYLLGWLLGLPLCDATSGPQPLLRSLPTPAPSREVRGERDLLCYRPVLVPSQTNPPPPPPPTLTSPNPSPSPSPFLTRHSTTPSRSILGFCLAGRERRDGDYHRFLFVAIRRRKAAWLKRASRKGGLCVDHHPRRSDKGRSIISAWP
jgi:hypothetical protein